MKVRNSGKRFDALFEEAQLLPKQSPVKAVAYREKVALENGSIDSSEFSSNPSFGSCDDLDSFVNVSISGILSDDDISSIQANDKHGSKSLPRFTVNTTRTRALLGAQPVFQKRKNNHVNPMGGENSLSSTKTPPLTPNSSEIISVYLSSNNKKNHTRDKNVLFADAENDYDNHQQVEIPLNQLSKSIRIQSSTFSPHAVHSSIPRNASLQLSSSESSLSNPEISRGDDDDHPFDRTGDFHGTSSHHTTGHCNTKAALEVELWKEILMTRVSRLGPHDLAVAKGLNELGAAHVRNKQYTEALAVYKKAARILRQHHGDLSLAVAHALDKVGLAASLCPTTTDPSMTLESPTSSSSPTHQQQQHGENLEWGLVAIKEALKIRLHFLGPWHVDVVDTLNNLAGIHLRRNEKHKAYDAYLQVLTVRIAIFGKNHASVAITAQTLGILSMSISNFHQAMNFFTVCLSIYKRGMHLKDGHPLVQQTFKKMDKMRSVIERTDLCRGSNRVT